LLIPLDFQKPKSLYINLYLWGQLPRSRLQVNGPSSATTIAALALGLKGELRRWIPPEAGKHTDQLAPFNLTLLFSNDLA